MGTLPQRLHHTDFNMETYYRDCTSETTMDTLLQRLYCRDLLQRLYYRDFTTDFIVETYCGDLWKGVEEEIGILCKVGFLTLTTSLAVVGRILDYHWLPLATIDLVGDNREYEV